jgi:hypothetical protein
VGDEAAEFEVGMAGNARSVGHGGGVLCLGLALSWVLRCGCDDAVVCCRVLATRKSYEANVLV